MVYLILLFNIFNVILSLIILYYLYIDNTKRRGSFKMHNDYEELKIGEAVYNKNLIKDEESLVITTNNIITENKEFEEKQEIIETEDIIIENENDKALLVPLENVEDSTFTHTSLHDNEQLELSNYGFEINKRRKLALKLSTMNGNSSR